VSVLHNLIAWVPLGLPAFVLVITTIVFFHELGHFSVARLFGVRIETFSIGFGPAIAKWKDRQGTQWKISWIPLGGYVKFFGDATAASTPDHELEERMTPEERAVAFPCKPLYQRVLIVAAGPIANFVLAIAVFAALFTFVGLPSPGTIIGDITPHSAAARAGLHTGDKITAIDGKKVTTFDSMRSLIWQKKGGAVDLSLLRNGRALHVSAAPHEFQTVNLFGDKVTIRGLGIAPLNDPANFIYTRVSPVQAVEMGAAETWARVDLTFRYIGRIFTGRSNGSQLHGIFEVAQATRQQAANGPYDLIFLIAVLSVSIGLVNLFPIPVLDGGHLLYYGCEAVLGRPLGVRAQDIGFRLGLAVILGLFLFATWNDLVRPNLF